MRLSQLMANLKAIPNNRRDLPIQIYDFTDSLQITAVKLCPRSQIESELCQYYFLPSTIRLIAVPQTRKRTVTELICVLETGIRALDVSTLEIEILLDDGTQYALAGVEFDEKNQTYAMTLGDRIL